MRSFEIEEKIQWILKELDRLEDGPSGVFSAWPTGMPRGTNDPIAALLQRADVNEVLDQIESYYSELDLPA